MNRNHKLSSVHGWIILDKKKGNSSAWAVSQVRKILGVSKAGHAGTLDPLASGVLPIAIGEATKTVSFLQESSKSYSFSIVWGEERDTGDAEGVITSRSLIRPSHKQIVEICNFFIGDIIQIPPIYSAIKIEGRRSYDLARSGRFPELSPRSIRIDRLELIESMSDQANFIADCGKGTYIRSLAKDIAIKLGTVGYVGEIRRERVGELTSDKSISLEKLSKLVHKGCLDEALYPVETALADIPALPLTGSQAKSLKDGQFVRVDTMTKGTVVAVCDGFPIAIAHVEDCKIRPVRVFNFN